jgi:hypothetical protein
MYLNENKFTYYAYNNGSATDGGWWYRLSPYVNNNTELMHCPSWDGYTLWSIEGWSYGFNMQLNYRKVNQVQNGVIMLADAYWYFCSQNWALTWVGSPSAAWNYDSGFGFAPGSLQTGGVYRPHNDRQVVNVIYPDSHGESKAYPDLKESMFEMTTVE